MDHIRRSDTTDTRIVACLVQLSPIKLIANVGVKPLIFGDSGDIKEIVGDAFLPPMTMTSTAVEGDSDILRQKVDRQAAI